MEKANRKRFFLFFFFSSPQVLHTHAHKWEKVKQVTLLCLCTYTMTRQEQWEKHKTFSSRLNCAWVSIYARKRIAKIILILFSIFIIGHHQCTCTHTRTKSLQSSCQPSFYLTNTLMWCAHECMSTCVSWIQSQVRVRIQSITCRSTIIVSLCAWLRIDVSRICSGY